MYNYMMDPANWGGNLVCRFYQREFLLLLWLMIGLQTDEIGMAEEAAYANPPVGVSHPMSVPYSTPEGHRATKRSKYRIYVMSI